MNNPSLYYPIVDPSIRMVKVQFNNELEDMRVIEAKEYTYKTTDTELEVYDCVVVQAKSGFELATVTSVDVTPPIDKQGLAFKWVVQKVDFTALDAILLRETKLIQQINQKRVDHQRQQMVEAIGISQADVQSLMIDHEIIGEQGSGIGNEPE